MEQKTVFQCDPAGFFLYPVVAHELALQPGVFNIPFGAIGKEPPTAGIGEVAQVKSDDWQIVEDHRRDALYYIEIPATAEIPAALSLYQIGSTQNVNGVEVSYDGGGPIPDWLTATLPEAEKEPTTPLIG